jgi:hypothetical protein
MSEFDSADGDDLTALKSSKDAWFDALDEAIAERERRLAELEKKI